MAPQQTDINNETSDDFNFVFDETILAKSTENEKPQFNEINGFENHSQEQRIEQGRSQSADQKRQFALLNSIPVTLTLEVASVDISIGELLSLEYDSIVELDKLAGEPLDVKVNGIILGKAEVVVVNEKYGLRLLEVNINELGELNL